MKIKDIKHVEFVGERLFYFAYGVIKITASNIDEITQTLQAKNYHKLNKMAAQSGWFHHSVEQAEPLSLAVSFKDGSEEEISPDAFSCTSIYLDDYVAESSYLVVMKEIPKAGVRLRAKAQKLTELGEREFDASRVFYNCSSYDEICYSLGVAGSQNCDHFDINSVIYIDDIDELKRFVSEQSGHEFEEGEEDIEGICEWLESEQDICALKEKFSLFDATISDYKDDAHSCAFVLDADHQVRYKIGQLAYMLPLYYDDEYTTSEDLVELSELKEALKI